MHAERRWAIISTSAQRDIAAAVSVAASLSHISQFTLVRDLVCLRRGQSKSGLPSLVRMVGISIL